MRKIIIAGMALVSMLAVSGCNSSSIQNINVAEIQTDAVLACGFVPTAVTIASIVSGGNAIAISSGAIAEAICTGIKSQAAVTTTTTTKAAKLGYLKMADGTTLRVAPSPVKVDIVLPNGTKLVITGYSVK